MIPHFPSLPFLSPFLLLLLLLLLFNILPPTSGTPITLPQSSSDPGTWTSVPPLPFPRQEHATVYVASYIYIIGGVLPSPYLNNTSDPFPTTPSVQRYSLQTQTWSDAAPLPIPLNHANTAVLNGRIYILGGLTPSPSLSNPSIWIATPIVLLYDPILNTWNTLNPIPLNLAVGSAAVGVRGNTIYLAGGLTSLDITQAYQPTVNHFTAWNAGTQVWSVLEPMPEGRDHAGVGMLVDQGLFCVLGGRENGMDNVRGDVFLWEFRTGKWKLGRGMSVPRGGVASAVVGHEIFVIGGEGNPEAGSGGVFNQNEAYDVLENTWRSYEVMDVPRHGTSAVAVNNKIYIPGGGTKEGGAPTSYFSYFEVPSAA